MGEFFISTTRELRSLGATMASIRAAIDRGELFRVIGERYGDPRTPKDAVLAMRMGGRLGCVSALALRGAWCPPDCGTHVVFPSSASGRRSAGREVGTTVVRHRHGRSDRTGSAFAVAPLDLAIAEALECQPPHLLIAILDSLLHRRLISRNRLEVLIRRGPVAVHHLAAELDARSESGTESIVRYRLTASGLAVKVQVVLRAPYRLDLELDDWLAIEVDGRKPHTQKESFTRDRRRVSRVMREGRIVLQFAYATVMCDWDFVIETIRAVMEQHAPVRRP